MKRFSCTSAFLIAILFASCNRTADTTDNNSYCDTITHHAAFLNLSHRPDGILIAEIANPWNKDNTLARYALVHRDSILPENLSQDIRIVRTPVEHAAVFSAVHTNAMKELGVLGSLSAIADAIYFPPNDTVTNLLLSGRIYDLGNSANPANELLAASKSEVVLRSPMNGITSPKLPAGVVAIECADYMEPSPIGRAEWILFYGELFGKGKLARDILDNVIDEYSRLVFKAGCSATPKPKILVETETSGVWYVPAGQSYAARLYADAGADYPWAVSEGQGSLSLSLEEVAAKALDADLWLVRSYGYETTPETLLKLNPRYSGFKALKNGNVFSCDSEKRNIFSETSFHPEYILADYISIFHPDVMPDYEPRYFKK